MKRPNRLLWGGVGGLLWVWLQLAYSSVAQVQLTPDRLSPNLAPNPVQNPIQNPAPDTRQNLPRSNSLPGLYTSCPTPILSRLKRHRVAPSDSLQSIAQQYNLLPNTLINFNPVLKGGKAPVGSDLLIPPFNGIKVQVPAGANWQDLSKAYGVRADLLFELNGCQLVPKIVFIPGVNWQAGTPDRKDNYTGLAGYPLPEKAKVGLSYGWQPKALNQGTFFHSGIDLLAELGTPVLAAGSGIAVYVAQEGTYGFLVIIDHGNNRQTRYAHLSRFNVKMGQTVKTGDILGFVGTTGQPDIAPPHLHFEVRSRLPGGWVAQDPLLHLPTKP